MDSHDLNRFQSSIISDVELATWPNRQGWTWWLRRGIWGLILMLVLLLIAGVMYQAISTAADSRRYPPPGQLVDAGGYRLHVHCMGEGSPTVILEAAAQATSAHWIWIQPEIAKSTRVCAYDRAGMGWSDLGPQPRDARQIAGELHTLLGNMGNGPYVLVGHSLGGLYTRMYAAQYPDEVAGIVLIDATHPDQWEHLPAELALPDERLMAVAPVFAEIGLTRLLGLFPADPNLDLPTQQRAEVTAFNGSTKFMRAFAREIMAIPAATAQVNESGGLGDIPLVVLTAGKTFDDLSPELKPVAQPVWRALQAELASLSSNTLHQHAVEASHESLVLNQEDAQTTIGAILQVIDAVCTGQKLTP